MPSQVDRGKPRTTVRRPAAPSRVLSGRDGAPRRRRSVRGLALGLAAVALLSGVPPAQAEGVRRLSGSLGVFYRRNSGAVEQARHADYLDQRLDLKLDGTLLGPRLGNYSVSGGLQFLRLKGPEDAHNLTRRRLGTRIHLLPLSPVTLSGHYSRAWSGVAGPSVDTGRSQAWGGTLNSRLLPRSYSAAEVDRRRDEYTAGPQKATTYRLAHAQGVVLGPHSLNLDYNFTDRRQNSPLTGQDYSTRRHGGRADAHLELGGAGKLGAWLQVDRERSRTLSGAAASRRLENTAANLDLQTPLGSSLTWRQSYADETYRFDSSGQAKSLRFQIAEERLEGRRAFLSGTDIHALLRGQYSHVSGQQDLWLATAVAELEHPRPGRLSLSPQAGIHFFSGGLGDGSDLGGLLGLTLRFRMDPTWIELGARTEKTKATGLRGQLDGGSFQGFSPRQVGAQRVNAARASVRSSAGRLFCHADYEFQQIENSSLGIDFMLHSVNGSASLYASERLRFDLGANYSTTDNSGVDFDQDYRSLSSTLAVNIRPLAMLEVRSQGSYGRVPAGSPEAYWLLDNSLAYHFPRLEISLVHHVERRAPDPSRFERGRTERLLELRATRNFSTVL